MTVAELIEKLSKEDPNSIVVVGCEIDNCNYHPTSGFGGLVSTTNGSVVSIYTNDRKDLTWKPTEFDDED